MFCLYFICILYVFYMYFICILFVCFICVLFVCFYLCVFLYVTLSKDGAHDTERSTHFLRRREPSEASGRAARSRGGEEDKEDEEGYGGRRDNEHEGRRSPG